MSFIYIPFIIRQPSASPRLHSQRLGRSHRPDSHISSDGHVPLRQPAELLHKDKSQDGMWPKEMSEENENENEKIKIKNGYVYLV